MGVFFVVEEHPHFLWLLNHRPREVCQEFPRVLGLTKGRGRVPCTNHKLNEVLSKRRALRCVLVDGFDLFAGESGRIRFGTSSQMLVNDLDHSVL